MSDLTEDQDAFQGWCTAKGTPSAVARPLDEALTILGAWRCIRPIAG